MVCFLWRNSDFLHLRVKIRVVNFSKKLANLNFWSKNSGWQVLHTEKSDFRISTKHVFNVGNACREFKSGATQISTYSETSKLLGSVAQRSYIKLEIWVVNLDKLRNGHDFCINNLGCRVLLKVCIYALEIRLAN